MFNPEPRIGWLLRTSRLTRLPGTGARDFAGLLGEQGVSADASRVSRWETGQVPASLAVIEAYEQIVDLDPGGLRAIATFQRRVGSGRIVSPGSLTGDRCRPEWLERMLDAVLDGDPDGRAWLEFSLAVAGSDRPLVLPRSVWRSLAGRLVRQISVSIGNAYLGRIEAAILLTTHPSAQRALLHAIGEVVTEPDIPIATDPMSLLQEIEGPHANDLVLRLLDQEPAATRNAAAWAAASKLGRSHFDQEELERLETLVLRLASQHGLDRSGTFSGLVDLVDVLPAESRLAVAQAMRGDRQGTGSPGVESAPDAAEVVLFVEEVVGELGHEDPMLRTLVSLALVDSRAEHRFLATFTLHQSPYRTILAEAAARRIAAHVDDGRRLDAELAHRFMVMLSVVAGATEAELMLRIAEDPFSELQSMGLMAVAHLPPGAAPRRPHLEELIEGPDDTLARTATYCAGMTGDPVLRRVVEHPGISASRRRTAQWWVDHGAAIHEAPPGRERLSARG